VCASFWRPLSRRGFVGTGSYPAPSYTLSGGLSASPPASLLTTTLRDFRCARSAVTAAGLGRRTTADQCAFHRFDPSFATLAGCCAAQAGSAPLVVHARSLTPHPVACHDPCLPRQRREVRFRLSRRSRRCLAAAPFTAGKMRLSDFCNRLYKTSTLRTVRFPAAVFRLAPERDRRLILGLWPHGSGAWAPRLRLPDEPPSGASLDGEPPALASAATLTRASEVEAPGAHGHPTPRSPGGASIECSSAPSLPIRAFSAADRACDDSL
jgi:hypothetical protein